MTPTTSTRLRLQATRLVHALTALLVGDQAYYDTAADFHEELHAGICCAKRAHCFATRHADCISYWHSLLQPHAYPEAAHRFYTHAFTQRSKAATCMPVRTLAAIANCMGTCNTSEAWYLEAELHRQVTEARDSQHACRAEYMVFLTQAMQLNIRRTAECDSDQLAPCACRLALARSLSGNVAPIWQPGLLSAQSCKVDAFGTCIPFGLPFGHAMPSDQRLQAYTIAAQAVDMRARRSAVVWRIYDSSTTFVDWGADEYNTIVENGWSAGHLTTNVTPATCRSNSTFRNGSRSVSRMVQLGVCNMSEAAMARLASYATRWVQQEALPPLASLTAGTQAWNVEFHGKEVAEAGPTEPGTCGMVLKHPATLSSASFGSVGGLPTFSQAELDTVRSDNLPRLAPQLVMVALIQLV